MSWQHAVDDYICLRQVGRCIPIKVYTGMELVRSCKSCSMLTDRCVAIKCQPDSSANTVYCSCSSFCVEALTG